MTQNLMDRLASYRPASVQLDEEWACAQEEVRTRLDSAASSDLPLRLDLTAEPERRRGRSFAPLAASAAVAAVAASVLVVVGLHGSDGSGGDATSGGSGTPVAGVAQGQFVYEQTDASVYGKSGKLIGTQYELTWVSPDGRTWEELRLATTGKKLDCQASRAPEHATVLAPTESYLAGLPTDPTRLASYLRAAVVRPEISAHLAASPAVDQMVSDVVGMLLGRSGLLTSRKLRSALLAVAEALPGSRVDRSATDLEGRPAISIVRNRHTTRATRGTLHQTAFYDPKSGLFVGGRTSAPASRAGATSASLVVRKIVDSVPASVLSCPVR